MKRGMRMKKKTLHMLLIAALVFTCWLQFPVGAHPKKVVPGVMATCVKTGLTEGKKCVLCGKALVAQQEIPATGLHIYDNDFDRDCNNCSYTREVNCSFEFVNYRLLLADENEKHKNFRVVVYKLGSQTVEDPTDEEALQAIDSAAQTVWGITEINRTTLTDAGNYLVMLKYNSGVGAAVKVPMALTITDEPKLLVGDDNRITVIDKNTANQNHELTVFHLGEATVADPKNETEVRNAAISAQTYTGLTELNEMMIAQGGNYVFYLRYETVEGVKQTVTLTKTLTSRPALHVDEDNRLVVENEDETLRFFRVFIYYLGEQTAADIYDEEALLELAGGYDDYWEIKGIRKAVLSEPGNYVIHLHYNVESGQKETVALRVKI